MADLTTLNARLTEAETALHKLQTGTRVVEVTSPDGSKASFSQVTIGDLQTYVRSLQQQIETVNSGPRRSLLFEFGR